MSIGIGIIGTGGISQAHAQAYRDLAPAVRLVAVADIDESKAREAATQWGVERVFADYRELLALDAVDAVSICTPTSAHSAPAIAALDSARARSTQQCVKREGLQIDRILNCISGKIR